MNRNQPEYQALAEFRFLIRRYLNNGEKAARSVGLEPQQYQVCWRCAACRRASSPPSAAWPSVFRSVHHSAVELVDRMEKRGLFRRERSKTDRRQVLVHVTPRGEKLLSRLVRHRIAELQRHRPALARPSLAR